MMTQGHDDRPMVEQLGHSPSDRPFDGDWVRQRRGRNWLILVALLGLCALFYFITVIRMNPGRNDAVEASRQRALNGLARSEGLHPSDLPAEVRHPEDSAPAGADRHD